MTRLCWHRGVVEVRFQPIRKLVARRQWVVSTTPRTLYALSREPVAIVQEADWLPGKLWTRTENIAPTPGFDAQTFQAADSRCLM